MRRFFKRPLFDLHDPFFFPFQRPTHYRIRVPVRVQPPPQRNAHQTFDRFFEEHGVNENEKQFFQKNYPEKYQKKITPYQVLGVQEGATLDQIKEAYRTKALKYHPKNDSSQEAAKQFEILASAYNELAQQISHREQDNTFGTFFNDFQKQINSFFGPIKKKIQNVTQKIEKKPEKTEVSEELSKDQFIKNADLYSESTYAQTHNGRNTKLVIEKQYRKDGKILKVKRQEKYNENGVKQITETLDDGKQVKKKTFSENKETKAIGE